MSSDEFLAFNQAWIEQAGRHLSRAVSWAPSLMARLSGRARRRHRRRSDSPEPRRVVKSKPGWAAYIEAHMSCCRSSRGQGGDVIQCRAGLTAAGVRTLDLSGSLVDRLRCQQGLRLHPTVKPVAMIGDALLDLTRRGDIVLDPFLGSGSTVIAAEKSGRACYGVEVDPLYVDNVLVASRQSPDTRP